MWVVRNINIVVGVAILVIIIAFSKKILDFLGVNDEDVPDFGPTDYIMGGGNPDVFNEEPMVSKLSEVLHDWFFWPVASPRCQVYRDLLELEDNEFIKVMNTYKKRNKRTVRRDMNAVWVDGCPWGEYEADNGTTAHYAIFDRMDDLEVK